MNVYELARRHRRRLLAAEGEVVQDLIERYGQAYLFLLEESGRFHGMIQARAAELGISPAEVATTDPSWPFRAGNLDAQRDAIAKEVADLAARGQIATVRLQGMGVRYAMEDARDQAAQAAADRLRNPSARLTARAKDAIEGVWTKPNLRAFESLVGQTADGSPLSDLFRRAAGASAEEMNQSLIAGFVLGQGTDVTARMLKKNLDGNAARAIRIARTETIRAYRIGMATSFQENPDIVGGWVWHSALDGNTCLACILKHGERHPVTDVLSDHVMGRCAMVPETPSWAELGRKFGLDLGDVPESRPRVELGSEWLAAQSSVIQDQIMGATRAGLYRAGKVYPDDLIRRVDDPVWGESWQVTPLKDLPKPPPPKPVPVAPDPPKPLAVVPQGRAELEKLKPRSEKGTGA